MKKFVSTLLTLVMVLSLFSVCVVPAYAKDDCGYNVTSTMTELIADGGEALAGQCFSISTADELMAFAEYVNHNGVTEGVTFYINRDINLVDQLWEPIGASGAHPFKGVFDGCGFAVLNLNSELETNDMALFGYVEGETAVIKNLGVMGTISGANHLAGIAANLVDGSILNCWNSVDLTGGNYLGGIVAEVKNGTIENCCNHAYINGKDSVGAVAGRVSGSSSILYSYYVYYSADAAVGQASNDSTVSIFRFASASTEVLTEKRLTVFDKESEDLIALLNLWVKQQPNSEKFREWVYDTSGTGVSRTDGRYPSHRYPGYIDVKYGIYNATSSMTALYDSGANAVRNGYYSISTSTELFYLAEYVNSGKLTESVTFYLTSDLALILAIGDVLQVLWDPIGNDDDNPFCGIFDGQGYVITGMIIPSGSHKGLFGYVDSANAVIKNLGCNGVYTCLNHVGGIVGDLVSGSVMNCWFSGTISADDNLGGIAGSIDNGRIENCCCFCEVVGDRNVGGIVGDTTAASQIKYCYYSPNCPQACGNDEGTVSNLVTYEESGTDFTLVRQISVAENPTVKLLNALNHWVNDLAPDQISYRNWKIDDSAESVARTLGKHPSHLFPGDNSGMKQAEEPDDIVNEQGNPYNVIYHPDATMTELYNSGENGIAGGHYSIESGDEMKLLADYVNEGHTTKDMTFYLTRDVLITTQGFGNNYSGWMPIGRDTNLVDISTYARYFRGTFDGCGYTVNGMFISKNERDEAALFGNTWGATIKNLGVIGGIVAENKCAGIVAEAIESKIINCWAAVSIQAEDRVGGIAGEITDTDIINCVSYGQMLAYGGSLSAVAGGIVGDTDGTCNLEHCYYMMSYVTKPYEKISGKTNAEVIGFTYDFIGDEYICYLDEPTTIDDVTTTNVLTALNAWVYAQDNGQYSGWYNSTLAITIADISGHFPRLMTPNTYESEVNTDYAGDYEAKCTMTELYSMQSDGIEGCAYSINGLDDLENFRKYVNEGFRTEGVIFFLARDVDMSAKYSVDTERSWVPIGNVDNPFKGIFDGQGYTIKYLYINTASEDVGLFGHISGRASVVKNLGVSGFVRGGTNSAAICGDFNFGTIANCWTSAEIAALGINAGGIAGGANSGTILNCANYGIVIGVSAYGAIVGFAFNTVLENCFYLYASCQQATSMSSTVFQTNVYHFNGTSMACILDEKINVCGTETKNCLTALKLYVDGHPQENYCYWTVGNTEEYMLQGVEFFPVLVSASGTMGGIDLKQVVATYNGREYNSLLSAVGDANDNPEGGDVQLAVNLVYRDRDDIVMDDNVRLVTGDYTLNLRSGLKVNDMQQLDGYFIINNDGGRLYTWDKDKNDYQLFLYASKDADPSCNSVYYGVESLYFTSQPVKNNLPGAYNLTLLDGEFIVNSTVDSGNPHIFPAGSTVTVDKNGGFTVSENARIRTTGNNSQIVMNGGTLKIANVTLDPNGGKRMVGVFEDDGGKVSLPFAYRDGYTIRGWSDGVNTYNAGSKVDAQTAVTLIAQWRIGDGVDPYPGDDFYRDRDVPVYNIPINVIQSTGGEIKPGTDKATKGQNITYSFTLRTDYRLKNVLLDGQSVELDDNHEYHLVSISAPHTLVALYTPVTLANYYTWENPFDDIKKTDWCYDNVRFVSSAGLFNGTTANLFSPTRTMTRDMVVVVLWRLAGCPVMPDTGVSFPDVPQGNYAYDAVRWANQFGIVQGFFDGSFGYGKAVTREQLVTFLFRFAKNYAGDDISKYDTTNILGYTDVLEISKGMTQPFQWAIGAGIVNGTTDTTLSPKTVTNRGQVAAILSRYCNRFYLQAPVVNPDQF